MSSKNLLILVTVLALLAAAAFLTRSCGPAPLADAPAIGDPIFPGLDVNRTQRITVVSPDGSNCLTHAEGTWVVSSLHDYPADFARIREQLTGLLDMKIGQVMRADDVTRSETGLDEAATVVTLEGSDGTAIASLRVGAPRTTSSPAGGFGGGGYPDGQYVAVNDEHIVVVTRSLRGLSTSPTEWIQRQLLQVDADEIASIAVENEDEAYVILNDTNQVMTLEGLNEEETFESGSAGQLKRALAYLSCQDVADPALGDEVMALADPSARYTATLRDGRIYSVSLGASTNDARYARFAITGDEENAYLQQWTYLIPSYAADSMTPARDTLVKPVEDDEPTAEADPETDRPTEPEAEPNAAPEAATETEPGVMDAEEVPPAA